MITSLEPAKNLINLKKLYCYCNQIKSLEPIKNLINLKVLDCYGNQIQSLESINNLINLEILYYSYNQIEYIPPNIARRLRMLENKQSINNKSQNYYNCDDNYCIRESVGNSIQNILNIKPTNINLHHYILDDDIFTSKTKKILFDYIGCKDVHSTLNITFEELLLHVINRIEINKHKSEIKSVLNMKILDSECECFYRKIF